MTVGPRAFRDTLGRMPTGVTVITTTARDGEMHGVTIGSFSSLSLEPPLVLFCLDKDANCRQAFLDSTHFAVNVLAEDQSNLSSIFATKDTPRPWRELDYSIGAASGAPLMAGAVAQIECATEAIHDGGDHDILIGRARALASDGDGRPLVFFAGGYRRLSDIDGSS